MKNQKMIKVVAMVTLLGVGCSIFTQEAYAHHKKKNKEWKHYDKQSKRYYKKWKHHHPYYGRKVTFPELLATSILVAGSKYFYYEGTFYNKRNGAYVVVDAPMGANVRMLPVGSKRILVNGRRYYYYNGVYFVKKPRGYYVVEDPFYQVYEFPQQVKFIDDTNVFSMNTSVPVKIIDPSIRGEEYTVNILNVNGSYTPIKIVAVKNGYLGPQGELYTDFPKVEQLKVMYGK